MSLSSFFGWYVLFTIMAGMVITVVVGVPAILFVEICEFFERKNEKRK